MGLPGLARKSVESGAGGVASPLKSAAPNAGMKEIQRRIGDWNGKALAQGKSWGALSASFSGFHALARVCRGGKEDRWNSILGSAATGAYLSRQGTLFRVTELSYCRRFSILITLFLSTQAALKQCYKELHHMQDLHTFWIICLLHLIRKEKIENSISRMHQLKIAVTKLYYQNKV